MVESHAAAAPNIDFEGDRRELTAWTDDLGPRILSRAGIVRGMRVLDVGCGFGAWTRAALRVIGPSGRLVALDHDPAAIRQLQSWMQGVSPRVLRVVCADAVDFLEESAEDSFDGVLLFDVLQFLRPWQRVFHLAKRVLSKGGAAVVNPGLFHHLDALQAEKLLLAIFQAGFRPAARFTERVVHYRRFAEDEIWSFRNDRLRISPFRARVYAATWFIPKGRVTTYGALANHLKSRSPRAVGQALRTNPFAPIVPCHRVIPSDLAPGGFGGKRDPSAVRRKTMLLSQEGIRFTEGRLADPNALWKFPETPG